MKNGVAAVWNKEKGVTRKELLRLTGVLDRIPGLRAYALKPVPGLLASFPYPVDTLAYFLQAHGIKTYHRVERASALVQA